MGGSHFKIFSWVYWRCRLRDNGVFSTHEVPRRLLLWLQIGTQTKDFKPFLATYSRGVKWSIMPFGFFGGLPMGLCPCDPFPGLLDYETVASISLRAPRWVSIPVIPLLYHCTGHSSIILSKSQPYTAALPCPSWAGEARTDWKPSRCLSDSYWDRR